MAPEKILLSNKLFQNHYLPPKINHTHCYNDRQFIGTMPKEMVQRSSEVVGLTLVLFGRFLACLGYCLDAQHFLIDTLELTITEIESS